MREGPLSSPRDTKWPLHPKPGLVHGQTWSLRGLRGWMEPRPLTGASVGDATPTAARWRGAQKRRRLNRHGHAVAHRQWLSCLFSSHIKGTHLKCLQEDALSAVSREYILQCNTGGRGRCFSGSVQTWRQPALSLALPTCREPDRLVLSLSVCPEDQVPYPVPKTDSSRQGCGAGMGFGNSRSQEGGTGGKPAAGSSHTHCTCCPLCADHRGRGEGWAGPLLN